MQKEWQPLEEVIGAALARLDAQLRDRPVGIDMPDDMLLVPLDSVLFGYRHADYRQLAVLDAGDVVRLRAAEGAQEAARMLLFGGVPIKEPIVQYGPFVMNDEREIRQAIDDFQSGRMGEITRTATVARAT